MPDHRGNSASPVTASEPALEVSAARHTDRASLDPTRGPSLQGVNAPPHRPASATHIVARESYTPR